MCLENKKVLFLKELYMIRRGLLSDVSVIYGCVQHDDEVHVSILALSYD